MRQRASPRFFLARRRMSRCGRRIGNRPQVYNLFECIRVEMKMGSSEGYNAETGFNQPTQKPKPVEPNDYQSIYRIRRSQEKYQLLREDCRRDDHRGGQIAGHPPGAAPVGRKAPGTLAWGDEGEMDSLKIMRVLRDSPFSM